MFVYNYVHCGALWRMLIAAAVSTLHLFDRVNLTFNFLISNEMGDQELSCTIHLPGLVMTCPAVFTRATLC